MAINFFDTTFIFTIIGTALKIIYLSPFFGYYILSKKINKLNKTNNDKLLVGGFIFGFINFIIIFTINILVYLGKMNPENTTLTTMLVGQTMSNVFLIISYILLFIGLLKLSKVKFDSFKIYETIIFFFLNGIIIITSGHDILLSLNIFSYITVTYFLINSFILMSYLTKKLKEKNYFLIYIGTFLLLIESIIYIKMYIIVTGTFPDVKLFYNYRYFMYLFGILAIFFILIPNLSFYIKLRSKKIIKLNEKDSLIEKTIKELYNETQKIYGTTTGNLHMNACDSFYQENGKKVECDGLNFKNLSETEQKDYLKILLRIYVKVMGRELVLKIINNIISKENKPLLEECFPYEQDKLPDVIQPDKLMIKN